MSCGSKFTTIEVLAPIGDTGRAIMHKDLVIVPSGGARKLGQMIQQFLAQSGDAEGNG